MRISIINTERNERRYTRMELERRLVQMGYIRKRQSQGSAFLIKER